MTHARKIRSVLLPTLACLAVVALALMIAPDASAQFGLGEAAAPAGLKNPGVPALIGRILKALLGFVGTLFLILMIYAGFLYMTARGDSKKVDQAKQMITGAIIGIVIVAGSYAITDFVIKSITGQATQGSGSDSGSGADTGIPLGGTCHNTSDCQGTAVCENEKCVAI